MKTRYIAKHAGKVKDFKLVERLLTLSLERQLRCGDGGNPNTITHSTNCDCARLDKEINEIESKLS